MKAKLIGLRMMVKVNNNSLSFFVGKELKSGEYVFSIVCSQGRRNECKIPETSFLFYTYLFVLIKRPFQFF